MSQHHTNNSYTQNVLDIFSRTNTQTPTLHGHDKSLEAVASFLEIYRLPTKSLRINANIIQLVHTASVR